MSEDGKGWVAFAIAALVVVACVMALCGCVPIVEAEMLPEQVEHANGMPLDAISYDPPAWMPNCEKAYRIYDRTNGQQWWLLVMRRNMRDYSYVVLPLSEVER